MVAQGYTQEEGIDYDEAFAPVARIRKQSVLFGQASLMGFNVYQMDVKIALLYGTIEEEVYVCQPPGFEDPQFPDKVYKVKKLICYIKLLEPVQVYVDDIIFGSTKKSLCVEFEHMMHKRFQMSSMGELTFFLGLQVKQKMMESSLAKTRQVCDNKCRVTFSEHDSEITKDGKVIGRGIRKKGLYVMKLGNKPKEQICLATIDENSTLWHRRLGHANMRLIQSLASKELVRNLPKLKFDQHFCDACKIGKQAHASHKAKNIVSMTRCLELLHMDLFGPSAVRSYGGNRYTLVIVDDYSRYTWTRFLKDKTEAFDQFEIFSKKIQNQLGCTIVSIRTDHGREFDNEVQFREFCNANGITHNFSAPRTPQSNGVVERKNRVPGATRNE
ncbi:retrovirus-related pol polyprotein from transposon TNT 1-94 [Tanacetum coccineum]